MDINQSKENNDNNFNAINADIGKEKENVNTYGVKFTPDNKGSEYSCIQYSVNNGMHIVQDPPARHTENVKKKNKGKSGIALAWILLIISLLLMTCAAAFGVTLYAKYLFSVPDSYETPETNGSHLNNVYIDNSTPNFTTVQTEPGTLLSMEEAIAAVKDSVVEITTETVNSGFGGYSQYVVSGAGSGVIVSEGGFIITNHHVIEGASNITVRLTDGTEYTAKLIGSDSKTDVAVISITPESGKKLKTAVIGNCDSLRLGQTVIAIGNPLGELGGTVTDGIISSLAREIKMDGSGTMTLLQTNAAVSPGNSGGGLFDLYGRLIGIVNAKSTGDGIEGISFAIPVNTAWDIAQQIINNGYVAGRPALNITLEEVRYGFGLMGQTYYQVVVREAPEDSAVKEGDIIEAIDGVTVSTLTDISEIVASHEIGDVLNVIITRNHKYIEVQITVVEYVPDETYSG